ncbi:MAG: DUF1232 domain-containing protein [Bacteroidetes bacterium]|nr:MAG: DUF1232 domain-containing protein [Bacteroidota bacterium]
MTDSQEPLHQYEPHFNENRFWRKLNRYARQAGLKLVYTALLLYYAYRRQETPAWAKRVVFGVLGYLIMPIDFIPDLSPFIGYTDDLGVLGIGLVTIAAYVNTDVKQQAREQLKKWFGDYNEDELEEVDKQL